MVILKVIRHTDGGEAYLRNALNYVEDDRAIALKGYGVDAHDPGNAFDQMMSVKGYYGKTGDNPLMQFIVNYDNTVADSKTASDMTEQIVGGLAENYQLVTAIHDKHRGSSHYHAHIIMNSVNYNDGRLYNSSIEHLNELRQHISEVTGRCCKIKFK